MRLKKSWPLDEWGDPVEVDGAWLPSRFTVVMEHDDPPTTVRLRICLIDGQWHATELCFLNPDDVPLQIHRVTEDVVRRLPKLVTREVSQIETMPLDVDGRPLTAESRTDFMQAVERRQRRRLIDSDLLRSVATVYTAAPNRPAKAVEEHFVVSAATASRWVKLARERGFLKPRGES
jgi:hypothetical protein